MQKDAMDLHASASIVQAWRRSDGLNYRKFFESSAPQAQRSRQLEA